MSARGAIWAHIQILGVPFIFYFWIGCKSTMRELEGFLCDIKELLISWRSSNDDIVQILKGKYGIETTKGQLNRSRCFAKSYDQIDLEGCFEGMFHHCHDLECWEKGTSSISSQERKHSRVFHLFLANHQMAISGSRPLTNTRHTTS